MQKLASTHSAALTLNAMRFLIIRLKSRPVTRDLAEGLQAQRARLGAAQEAYEEAREVRQAATAEIVWLDKVVDKAVMSIARRALEHVDGNRSAPVFKRLFPKAPSEQMKPVGGESQSQTVSAILSVVSSHAVDYEFVSDLADSLSEHQGALEATETRRSDLYVAEGRARTERNIILDATQRTYNNTFHQLMMVFPDDPSLVESYFKSLRKIDPDDTEEP